MNSQNNHELIVSGIHLELTPSLKTFVREKAERLFRHEERIVRVCSAAISCSASNAITRTPSSSTWRFPKAFNEPLFSRQEFDPPLRRRVFLWVEKAGPM